MSDEERRLNPASRGSGSLLQRDYWAVLAAPRTDARGVMDVVARHFPTFAPPGLMRFSRPDGDELPLEPGEDMEVEISMAGTHRVRVVHRDALSLTFATIEGHPEAGRITFGAYPNARGEVVFHIRSRTRTSSRRFAMGFRTAGEPMQASAWSGYIDRLAASVASGVRDVIHVESRQVDEAAADRETEAPAPTFRAADPHRSEE